VGLAQEQLEPVVAPAGRAALPVTEPTVAQAAVLAAIRAMVVAVVRGTPVQVVLALVELAEVAAHQVNILAAAAELDYLDKVLTALAALGQQATR